MAWVSLLLAKQRRKCCEFKMLDDSEHEELRKICKIEETEAYIRKHEASRNPADAETKHQKEDSHQNKRNVSTLQSGTRYATDVKNKQDEKMKRAPTEASLKEIALELLQVWFLGKAS